MMREIQEFILLMSQPNLSSICLTSAFLRYALRSFGLNTYINALSPEYLTGIISSPFEQSLSLRVFMVLFNPAGEGHSQLKRLPILIPAKVGEQSLMINSSDNLKMSPFQYCQLRLTNRIILYRSAFVNMIRNKSQHLLTIRVRCKIRLCDRIRARILRRAGFQRYRFSGKDRRDQTDRDVRMRR